MPCSLSGCLRLRRPLVRFGPEGSHRSPAIGSGAWAARPGAASGIAKHLKGARQSTSAQVGAVARDAAYCAARLCRVILTMLAVKPGSCKASSIFNLLAVLVRRLLGP